jgi:hypothetical protein
MPGENTNPHVTFSHTRRQQTANFSFQTLFGRTAGKDLRCPSFQPVAENRIAASQRQ